MTREEAVKDAMYFMRLDNTHEYFMWQLSDGTWSTISRLDQSLVDLSPCVAYVERDGRVTEYPNKNR